MLKRDPATRTSDNVADEIGRYLRWDGHRTWGFVIYRCTYESDSDWARFMEALRSELHLSLEHYKGLDLLESFKLTVFEDKDTLDDASTFSVREHFKEWVKTAPYQEQGKGPGLSQRYRYCIQVDDEALMTVLSDEYDGWVNLIKLDWERDESDPGIRDPVEDLTVGDVGWMMVDVRFFMVSNYYYLRPSYAWEYEYIRPPQVKCG